MSQKLLNIRIEKDLYNKFSSYCKRNNSNVSRELRKFMEGSIGYKGAVNTPEIKPDFRDVLDGGFHPGHPSLW